MHITQLSLITSLSIGLIACSHVPDEPQKPEPYSAQKPITHASTKTTSATNINFISTPLTKYGHFSGRVKAEWIDKGQMKLLEGFDYRDPNNILWSAPQGSVVNGASIPSMLWGIMGAPFTGEYREASVIHDVACVEKSRPWPMVHRAFYNAMRAGGVSKMRAKIMYAGVRFRGPRWKMDGTRGSLPSSTLSQQQFEQLKAQIEQNDLSLDQIDQFK